MWYAKNKEKEILLQAKNKNDLIKLLNINKHRIASGIVINNYEITYESDFIYMLVTNDIYEHPIYVSDSLKEFCKKTNINRQTVMSQIHGNYNSLRQNPKYKVIRIEK